MKKKKEKTIEAALKKENSKDQVKLLTPRARKATQSDIENLLNYQSSESKLDAADKASLVYLARHRISEGLSIFPWKKLDIEKEKVVADGW